jgi:hypothetical protein
VEGDQRTDSQVMPEINDNTTIEIPIRNLVAIIAGVVVAVFAYTEVTNRISVLERQITILEVDLDMNSEFRVKWPRGELGSLPDDMLQNSQIAALEKVVDLNTDFRNNWAPPEEVQESIRINYAQEVRLQYLEREVEEIKTSK